MNVKSEHRDPVMWPALHDGPNEPGPTDTAGEYRAGGQHSPAEPNAGLSGKSAGARVPGEVRTRVPVDVASDSVYPRIDEGTLSPAERGMDDPGHIARGKGAMSSS